MKLLQLTEGGRRGLLALGAVLAVLAIPAAAQAASPIITSTSFSGVGQSAATLKAAVDPAATKVKDAHFEYLTRAQYEANGQTFAGAASTPATEIQFSVKVKGDLQAASGTVTNLQPPSGGVLLVGQRVSGTGIAPGTTIASVSESSLTLSKPATAGGTEVTLTAQGAPIEGSGDTQDGATQITNLTTAEGTFAPGQTISGPGIEPETLIAAASADGKGLTLSKPATASASAAALSAAVGQPLAAHLTGLTPATPYVFRVLATNSKSEGTAGPATAFYTLSEAPLFGPCPNDAFRTGAFAPLGEPSAALPDCRAYEQASPTDKDGSDALGNPKYTFVEGAAVSFGSSFGIPGGQGAQEPPFFLARRGPGEAGWATQGLYPPAALATKARPLTGWAPGFAETYAEAIRLGAPRTRALFALHADGSPPTQITPYASFGNINSPSFFANFQYAGGSADGQTLLFEAPVPLPETEGGPPIPGSSPAGPSSGRNVYAWERASGQLTLASRMNTIAETESVLAKGAYAGPYNWAAKKIAQTSDSNYGRVEQHDVAGDGAVLFTSAADGHIYVRVNPTEPQSHLDGGGKCDEPAKACTIDVSASKRSTPDPAGPQPAAWQYSSADGSKVFFTSSEKLTDDANTGPEQPPAQIGGAKVGGSGLEEAQEDLLPGAHALGMAADPAGEYLYWANPTQGTIARAKIDGEGKLAEEEDAYVEPGETKAITHPKAEPGVYQFAPSTPQYVAVDAHHLYWTNTGPLGEEDVTKIEPLPVVGGGTIGRADIDPADCAPEPAPCEVEPEWITGATDPQGIAVSDPHVYWVNAQLEGRPGKVLQRSISRAELDGNGLEIDFYRWSRIELVPSGLAVGNGYVYAALEQPEPDKNEGYLLRVPLEGGAEKLAFVGEAGIRGVAVDSGHVYWAAQKEGTIGRADLELGQVENHFHPVAGTLTGLATAGSHLYWSTNGDSPPNPGNDLYRFEPPSETLTDLTPDPEDENGAEVLGVIGGSDDGSYLYFVANGDLDGAGPAEPGDCASSDKAWKVSGECSLYRWHEGTSELLGRLAPHGIRGEEEALAWVNTYTLPNKRLAKPALVSGDGRALVIRSEAPLAAGASGGNPQLYRFAVGEEPACLSCPPTGELPAAVGPDSSAHGGAGIFSAEFPGSLTPGGNPEPAAVRFLAAEGARVYFETDQALVGLDTNGQAGCPHATWIADLSGAGGANTCQDVYEWEAPGTGSCVKAAPAYSPLNQGCLYLISPGDRPGPGLFAGASASGQDVFFFTRSQLVGQDRDLLADVYDAREGGGLAAQNPQPAVPCEGEACRPGAAAPPPFQDPPHLSGPPDPKPERCRKGKVRRHGRCLKKHARHRKHHAKKGAAR